MSAGGRIFLTAGIVRCGSGWRPLQRKRPAQHDGASRRARQYVRPFPATNLLVVSLTGVRAVSVPTRSASGGPSLRRVIVAEQAHNTAGKMATFVTYILDAAAVL